MTSVQETFGNDVRRLRLDTLIFLRWIAIAGQTAALVFVYFILGFDFPVGLCFVFIVASAILNFGLRFGTSRSFRLGDIEAAYFAAWLFALSYRRPDQWLCDAFSRSGNNFRCLSSKKFNIFTWRFDACGCDISFR